jgi:hypothetical protein
LPTEVPYVPAPMTEMSPALGSTAKLWLATFSTVFSATPTSAIGFHYLDN